MITDKSSCNILAEVLSAHGVRDAVVSPGSRNAPLILAFDSRKEIKLTVVADERRRPSSPSEWHRHHGDP